MEGYTEKILRHAEHSGSGRIAVIAGRGSRSYVVEEVRNTVPTYLVNSLKELRQAFMDVAKTRQKLIALDLRELPIDETELFAGQLALSTGNIGLVYIITKTQFAFFDGVEFGFVVKE